MSAAMKAALQKSPVQDHRCRVAGCGGWASFGFAKPLVVGETQWFCGRHVPARLKLKPATGEGG